jgi:hypothetical protein
MYRPTIWKIAILSAAFGGLTVTGAGTALADTAHANILPLTVTAPVPADWPFDDLDDLDDLVPGHIVGWDEEWNDWYDDDWADD